MLPSRSYGRATIDPQQYAPETTLWEAAVRIAPLTAKSSSSGRLEEVDEPGNEAVVMRRS